MSNNCTVCVRGYPTSLTPERVADKLMIHFLRARNGGGEIINIEFAPDTSDCAMITFEDATVAQQVLKAKKHVLSVNGENYPLEVVAYPTKLNPDQIFVYVHMKIDYGSFPKGQEVLCNLFKQYKGIHFSFNSQKMVCSVKGTFMELQAFSSELLRSLSSKQRGSISEVNRRRPEARDVASRQVETEEENKEAAEGALSIQNSLDNLTEQLEDFSLVIDSDIYLYMQRFCGEELSKILNHSQVGVVDVNGEGVTTLYLQATLDGDEAIHALVSVRQAISRLSEQLEATLRKEKIRKSDLGVDGLRSLPGKLQSLYPQVLCHEDHEHIFLIGDLMDISLAKQHVEKFIARRGMSHDCQKDDTLQPSHLPVIHKRTAVPGQLKSSEESGLIKMKSPEPSGKTGHKLAARFNSNPSLPSFSSLGAPSVCKFPGSLPADYQPPNSELQFLAIADSEFKSQMGEYQKAPQGVKINPPQAMPGGTMSRSEGFTSLPFKGPSSLHVDPGVLRSLNLFDITGAVDCQKPESRPLLRRSHSFSWQEPLYSSGSTSVQQLEAKDSVSHMLKKAQEKIHLTLQKEVSQEKMTQKEKACEVESQNAEQTPTNFHLFAIQRSDGSLSGTQRVENLAKFPDYIYESFSYSELGMEGPKDEALTDLCNNLKGCQNEVVVFRDRYKLDLAYPREAKVKILEALKVSLSQRKATLDKSLLSHEVQHGGIVDVLSTESQSNQPLKESSKTNWRESSPISDNPARGKLPSQVQQLLEDSAAQHLPVQDFGNDKEAGQSKSLSHIPEANKQGLLGKLVAEGLPSELHFVQDHSKEECGGETGMPPRSRPLLLPSASDSLPLQEPVKRCPPAGEAVAPDVPQQAASPGRETHSEESQVCQSGPATLSHTPCYHTFGRTCSSVGNPSSSNVCASPVISGTFTVAVLSQSLPGYYRYPTLKLIYDIPDGVQQTGHPRPGHLYRGGRFEAYLPDIPEGRQLMMLLRKAFERDLTFQIQSCTSEERVTWGTLPHKTAMEKGKDRNGYPDAQYLRNLRLKLKDLGIE